MIRSISMIVWLALPAGALAADWHNQVDASVVACDADPAPCEAVASLLIRENRAGFLVVQDDAVSDPAIVGPLLHRLSQTTDHRLQLALADALTRAMRTSEGAFAGAWSALATEHPDAQVRATFVRGMRRASFEGVADGLRAAAQHAEPSTRAAAVETMGGHAQASGFLPELLHASTDAAPSVRLATVRALAWTDDARAKDAVRRMIADSDELVRRRAQAASR